MEYKESEVGCIHQMRKYLSELSGLPLTYTELKSYEEVTQLSKYGNRVVKYPSYNLNFIINGKKVGFIRKEQRKGGIWVWTNGEEDFPFDSDLSQIEVTIYRNVNDFGIDYINHGKKYNDSLGGGWYCKANLYQVNDKLFANMECAC